MCRILIVEDDFSLQELFQWILKTAGHEVIGIANDGEEAVQIYKTLPEKPEVILMDHRMPNKNGIQATKEILAFNAPSKIIFASADRNVKQSALGIGAVSFLAKPFPANTLLAEIEHVLSE